MSGPANQNRFGALLGLEPTPSHLVMFVSVVADGDQNVNVAETWQFA